MECIEEEINLLINDLQTIFNFDYVTDSGYGLKSYINDYKSFNIENDINDLFLNMDLSFSDKLMELIKQYKYSEVEVYKKADLDKKLFSKIRSNSSYHPKKITIIFLCLSLKLSFEESLDLLHRAGFSFSGSLKLDIISKYFLEHKIYDIFKFKEILYKNGLLKDVE